MISKREEFSYFWYYKGIILELEPSLLTFSKKKHKNCYFCIATQFYKYYSTGAKESIYKAGITN